MDEKISLDAIARYGNAYADKLIKDFFVDRAHITGKEILALSSIQQVNLFVVREIFKAWRQETENQKSIYFNNEHPEVKDALATYMSVVSNHIQVDKQHFAALLKKAVNETLLLIFDPYDFFSMVVGGNGDRLTIARFKEEIKYIKINRGPLERMLAKLQERKMTEVAGNEAFGVLDQILEEVNFTPEDLDGYIEKFSATVPLDPGKFYPSKPAPTPEPVIAKTAKPVSVESERSLNEKISSNRQQALADNLGKIVRIKDSLSINQKFMFTKVLFYGDFESFSRAVDDLDQLPNIDAALNYLESHSANWDRESPEFHEFMEMVERRFS